MRLPNWVNNWIKHFNKIKQRHDEFYKKPVKQGSEWTREDKYALLALVCPIVSVSIIVFVLCLDWHLAALFGFCWFMLWVRGLVSLERKANS